MEVTAILKTLRCCVDLYGYLPPTHNSQLDNPTGENKNNDVFSFLGALVEWGVFNLVHLAGFLRDSWPHPRCHQPVFSPVVCCHGPRPPCNWRRPPRGHSSRSIVFMWLAGCAGRRARCCHCPNRRSKITRRPLLVRSARRCEWFVLSIGCEPMQAAELAETWHIAKIEIAPNVGHITVMCVELPPRMRNATHQCGYTGLTIDLGWGAAHAYRYALTDNYAEMECS